MQGQVPTIEGGGSAPGHESRTKVRFLAYKLMISRDIDKPPTRIRSDKAPSLNVYFAHRKGRSPGQSVFCAASSVDGHSPPVIN